MSRKTVRDTLSQDEYQKAMAYKQMEDIIDAVPRNEKGRPSVPRVAPFLWAFRYAAVKDGFSRNEKGSSLRSMFRRSRKDIDNRAFSGYTCFKIRKLIGAGRKTLVHRHGVGIPRHFFLPEYQRGEVIIMAEKIVSCFIDEAGDFGDYDYHSPYYIVSVVIHDQSKFILHDIEGLDTYLSTLGFGNHALHTAPLIRREADYENLQMEERRKLFNLLFRFARKLPIRFFTAVVRKSECENSDELEAKITKAIKAELQKSDGFWHTFDKIIIYYDNGQKSLKRILNVLFNSLFTNVEVRKVNPADYKLFQVADLICTVEHIKQKIDLGMFSKTEAEFFSSRHDFKRDYWRKLDQQRI